MNLSLNLQQTLSKTSWDNDCDEPEKRKFELNTKIDDVELAELEQELDELLANLTMKHKRKLIDSSFFNNLRINPCDIITPLRFSELKAGVDIMASEQTLLQDYIKVLDKTFTTINRVVYFLASFFMTIPFTLLLFGKATLFELCFSTFLGVCISIGATILSKETKEKVVAKCQQKIYK